MVHPPGTTQSEAWLEDVPIPDVSKLVTEDDTPVDNIFSERQMSLLVASLHGGWTPMRDGAPRPFLALANVGIFANTKEPPVVPDVLLSLDVEPPADPTAKETRSYFVWEFSKFPDVVIEIVSNREGGELAQKRRRYAKYRIPNYVVYDPFHSLSETTLQAFRLAGDLYIPNRTLEFEGTGLGVTLWTGEWQRMQGTWLRWVDSQGNLLPTSEERAEAERERAEAERERAEAERERAEAERERAEAERQRASRLAEKLRALGIDPDAP
ncbi:MAG: Uma2 family endonuclease [Myxococcales bacterium]|nr:Uma2 family endonuclease [Myxococcales bacterium]